MDWVTVAVVIHIIGGYLALTSGFLAVVSRKTRGKHSWFGNVFYFSMTLSVLSVIALSGVRFSPFLFPIALFTLYMVTGGKLVFYLKRKSEFLKWWPIYAYCGIGIGLVMIFLAGYFFLYIDGIFALILAVFSGIQLSMSILDLRNNPGKTPQNKVFQHINKMGGGLIAATTAFIVVNFSFLPTLVGWLAPTVIGTFLLVYATRQRQRKLAGNGYKSKIASD